MPARPGTSRSDDSLPVASDGLAPAVPPLIVLDGLHDGMARKAAEAALWEDHEQLREAAARLSRDKQRLRLALDSGGLGSWDLDLKTHTYLEICRLWKMHFGLPPDDDLPGFTQEKFLLLLHPDDRERIHTLVTQAIERREDYAAEYRSVWPDGSVHWISAHGTLVADEDGQPVRMIGVTQDITERKTAEQERERELTDAQERADHDPLTGLLNHHAFHERLVQESSRARREGSYLAVAMLDIDGFGFFNKAYGHTFGNVVLRHVAERLRAVCRPYDTPARFGGDEFSLLLSGVGPAAVPEIEARLRADLRGMTFTPEGQEIAVPITISLGVAIFSGSRAAGLGAVKAADERLRREKTGGSAEAEGMRLSALSETAGFSMLDALVTAVDNKDRYTRRHSEDVLMHSLTIARAMALEEVLQKTVAVAALLHDVGKIGVPDAILRKPGGLTASEFNAVKQHPTMGAALVSTVPELAGTLDAVRHHHERWDGAGYPSGMRGTQTPLIARLMAVADAFSAMTTDRPYRRGMDRAVALSVLEAGAGVQWDPECVRAFLSAMAQTSESPLSGSIS